MRESDFRLQAKDGTPLFVREFLPEGTAKAVVQIAHGMAEHSARYARFAKALTDHGYAVYANDHRGHGKTAARREDLGYFADEGGWDLVVDDQFSLVEEIKSRHPRVPVFLFGHSMGSFIVRDAIARAGREWAGLVLSGTSHSLPAIQIWNQTLPRIERRRIGKRGKSWAISKLTFEAFNAKFDDPRTSCDWLSRDEAEVDKYLADPFCGFECCAQTWLDMFRGLQKVYSADVMAQMPPEMPVYVLAGELDPLNEKLSDIKKLHKAFERAGITNMTVRAYPGARHELLNELNRDEVTRDLIGWLEQQMGQLAAQ
jgi:alpha-beta hydrolase superfamily lysophospholipase